MSRPWQIMISVSKGSLDFSSARSRSQSPVAASADDLRAWTEAAPGLVFTGFRQQTATVAYVQRNFFDVIGVRPSLGGFAAEDFDGPGPTIEPRIVTDEIFRSQFGADSDAIGRVVIVDPSIGSGYRVVGVMPRGFTFPADRGAVGFLAPYLDSRFPPYSLTRVIARIPPGATADQIETRLLAAATARNTPRVGSSSGDRPIDAIDVEPLGRALGATPFDIGRLLLTEAALLVGAGAAIGLLIAVPFLRFSARLLPGDLALFRTAAIDWRVAAFSVAAAALLAGVVSIWPLRLASRGDAVSGHTRNVTSQARSLSRRLVVMVQVALALVLTVTGSLLVGSLLSIYAQTPPLTTKNILTTAVRFLGMTPRVGYLAPERATRVDALLEMSCGATRSSIARLIVGEQLGPVAAGLVAGGFVAAWAVRFVGSYLYQITSTDARVWAAATGLILLTAAAGTLVPALRTSRIDPTQAPKAE